MKVKKIRVIKKKKERMVASCPWCENYIYQYQTGKKPK